MAALDRFSHRVTPILERYAALYPQAPKIIFEGFREQGAHRRSIEAFAVRSNARRADKGLYAGFIVAMAFLVTSTFLIINGHSWEGTILGAVDVVALVSVFVYESQQQRQERERKAKTMIDAEQGEPKRDRSAELTTGAEEDATNNG